MTCAIRMSLMLTAAACIICFAGLLGRVEAAPAVRELGPEVELAEPAGGFVGRLKVSPLHGPAGTPVTITGEGFPAGQNFDLVWRTVRGQWKVTIAEYQGREYTPIAYRIARVASDTAGRIAAQFTAPEDFGFLHDVVVQQGARLLTQTAFNLDMSANIVGPASGPVGSLISVEVQGIGWRELEGSWVVLYDNKFTGFASAVTTGGTARFTLPAAGAPGLHLIEILHSDFGSPYRNTQQSPVPDRPQFKLGYTITPGPPVLPPPPEQQSQSRVRSLPLAGELRANPAFATVGEPVVVTGEGFTPGETYRLNWNTMVGNRMVATGWAEQGRAIAEAQADANGLVAFRFDTPDDLGGAHNLWVDVDGRQKAGAFWIAPKALPLDVGRGPAGTTFRVHLKGVGWSETGNIYTVVYDNGTSGYACAFNSQGDIEVVMQATGEPGWHFIDLYPAIYKGRETRPNNYRLPQLTYQQDHPGEDLPAFHFAFEVTKGDTAGSDLLLGAAAQR